MLDKNHRQHRTTLQTEFTEVVNILINNEPLAEKHRDHALTGEWKDHRDCHIKPDLVLIYRKPDDELLQLVRLNDNSCILKYHGYMPILRINE